MKQIFVDHGVNYKYVGSPHRDRMKVLPSYSRIRGKAQRAVYFDITGIRESEIIRIVPEILKIVELFEVQEENCRFDPNCRES